VAEENADVNTILGFAACCTVPILTAGSALLLRGIIRLRAWRRQNAFLTAMAGRTVIRLLLHFGIAIDQFVG